MAVTGRLILILALVAPAQACRPECRNETISEAKSPSGVYAASVFSRNCGATSGNNFQVSIYRAGSESDAPGNAFVVDFPAEYYYKGHARPEVKLKWLGDSNLEIEYTSGARIFTQAVMVEGVKVEYLSR